MMLARFEKIFEVFSIFFSIYFYTVLIQSVFGHPSFFSFFPPKSNKRRHKTCHSKHVISLESPPTQNYIDSLDQSILDNVLTFLTGKELLATTQVSRRYRFIQSSRFLWENLQSLAFSNSFCKAHPLQLDCLNQNKLYSLLFYKQLKTYTGYLMSEEISNDPLKIIITLHGCVYDLTVFSQEHPGGKAILVSGDDYC